MSNSTTHQEFVAERTKKKKSRINNKRILQLWTIALIPMIIVVLTRYVPMYGIIIAFKKFRYNLGIMGSEWVGFQNFEFFFKSSDFTRILRNTLGMNIMFIAINLIYLIENFWGKIL